MLPYGSMLLIAAFAVLFYWIGEADYQRGFLVAAASIAVGVLTLFLLQWGLLGNLCTQAGLLAVLFAINIIRKKNR